MASTKAAAKNERPTPTKVPTASAFSTCVGDAPIEPTAKNPMPAIKVAVPNASATMFVPINLDGEVALISSVLPKSRPHGRRDVPSSLDQPHPVQNLLPAPPVRR